MATMSRSIVLYRVVLCAVTFFAVARVLDPHQRWAAQELGGDRLEHFAVAYLLTLSLIKGFGPRHFWAPAGLLILVGVLIEGLQALPWFPGAFQLGDLLANTLGALAATLPAQLTSKAMGPNRA